MNGEDPVSRYFFAVKDRTVPVGQAAQRTGGSTSEPGYTLLLAIIFTIILSLALAVAIRPIRVISQRQKEDLLVYRGEHIARGIRDFYFRFGRFPFELEELLDVEPRLVRKIYKDPMTESGQWQLIYLGQENRSSLEYLKEEFLKKKKKKPRIDQKSGVGQQIIGIKSTSEETGFKEYQGSRVYSDWFFNALSGSRKDPLKQVKQKQK